MKIVLDNIYNTMDMIYACISEIIAES